MKYNPNYFLSRDLFIQDCRRKIDEQDDGEDEWKTCMYELITFWEDVMNLYRDYVDCYDPAEKKVRRKVLKYALKQFRKGLRLVQDAAKGMRMNLCDSEG